MLSFILNWVAWGAISHVFVYFIIYRPAILKKKGSEPHIVTQIFLFLAASIGGKVSAILAIAIILLSIKGMKVNNSK